MSEVFDKTDKEFKFKCSLEYLNHVQWIIKNMVFLSTHMKVFGFLVFSFCFFSSNYTFLNLICFLPLFVFWGLDSYFLKLERLYRIKYSERSSFLTSYTGFCMSVQEISFKEPYWKVFFSRTLLLFYGSFIFALCAKVYFICSGVL